MQVKSGSPGPGHHMTSNPVRSTSFAVRAAVLPSKATTRATGCRSSPASVRLASTRSPPKAPSDLRSIATGRAPPRAGRPRISRTSFTPVAPDRAGTPRGQPGLVWAAPSRCAPRRRRRGRAFGVLSPVVAAVSLAILALSAALFFGWVPRPPAALRCRTLVNVVDHHYGGGTPLVGQPASDEGLPGDRAGPQVGVCGDGDPGLPQGAPAQDGSCSRRSGHDAEAPLLAGG